MTRPCLSAALLLPVLLAACATPPGGTGDRTATIQRTVHGVAHISAPDLPTLAYGVAYAHAQDNVCQTAQQLLTVRGERSRWFGPRETALLGRRVLPNEQIDLFMAAHMDDTALQKAALTAGGDGGAMAAGYVAGYNRFLADHAGKLPAACNGREWVTPMTLADYGRLAELTMVQAGIAALADAMLAAAPPAAAAAMTETIDLADAAQAMREAGLLDSPFGSNAWAFGRETTANASGLLLGNPHFPWMGVNRFWQFHVTVPGVIDSMGAATGHGPIPSIGFNKDVAWTHTVSTGKRFTIHELALAANDATSYVIDGTTERMSSREVTIRVRNADGSLGEKKHRVWRSRFGPLIAMPRAGLTWTAKTAYALQDANAGNTRYAAAWLAINQAKSVEDIRQAHRTLGIPWVNTIAADRAGNAMYADVSVVPDVDAAMLERCKPSPAAAGLLRSAGLVVLDGSKAACNWRRDPASPVPGLTPIERMAVAVRGDWVQNSNDSFIHTHPAQRFPEISPLVGDASVNRPRTRAGLAEIPELLSRGKVTQASVQAKLFENRNTMALHVMPDLLAACIAPPSDAARDGCAALRGWDRANNAESRGAHLFREFWRGARVVPNVHRVGFDRARPVDTPSGLRMDDAAVAPKVWEALEKAVGAVRQAGFALDAPLGSLQRPLHSEEPIALHGGDEFEGVLNNIGTTSAGGIGPKGLRIDYGTSYVQTVTFDTRGPVAQAILTYGQSTDPASPHFTDQMKVFSRKEWPVLPFHAEDVAKARVGEVLRLTRP